MRHDKTAMAIFGYMRAFGIPKSQVLPGTVQKVCDILHLPAHDTKDLIKTIRSYY